MCARFGVDRSIRIKHGALIDAQLLAQVYVELTGGRQIGLGLAAEATEPQPCESAGPRLDLIVARPARPHDASADELERHAAFVATIIDPIWIRLEARSASL